MPKHIPEGYHTVTPYLVVRDVEAVLFPATLYVYVPDCDAVYAKALAAGAKSLAAPENKEYGDRNAGVEDACGNHWYIGTHLGGDA